METADIGVIGGSGLYHMPELQDARELEIDTPFGAPSDALRLGRIADKTVAFLARHHRDHLLMPTELNFRANIYAMKRLGVKYIISASAVGSMKNRYHPTHFVFPDQFIDRTRHRVDTFFGDGLVAHVGFSDPICPYLQERLYTASLEVGVPSHFGGTYLCMDGPQFSTRAESLLYRQWGVDVIGMTNLQEAKLAREAEIAYALVAMITDYDCWHEDEEDVSVENVVAVLHQNAEAASRTIANTIASIDLTHENPIHSALQYAILTRREAIPKHRKRELSAIVAKYLGD